MGRFGEFFKKKRISLGKTLREFCRDHRLDPGNMSRLERGKTPPPTDEEKLSQYAGYLHISKDTEEWQNFIDFANIDAGSIPNDIHNEKNLLDKLPVLFRLLRDKEITNHSLEELAKKIRES